MFLLTKTPFKEGFILDILIKDTTASFNFKIRLFNESGFDHFHCYNVLNHLAMSYS